MAVRTVLPRHSISRGNPTLTESNRAGRGGDAEMKTVALSLFGRLWRRHVAVAGQTLQADSGKIGAMRNAAPVGVRACVFDAYGTLFDYASAAERCRDALGEKLTPLTTLWREKQLQYTWLRALQGRHADYWQVTGDALDFTMETLGIHDKA